MAEQVQAALDQMVEPLLDLQNRGVFSRDEIRSIVDRRRQSEYALRRRGKLRKADFIGYIQAETQLEALRALRVQRITREERRANRGKTSQDDAKDSNTSGTSKIGDRHIVQLIHLLWTRTLRKFRDVSFFLEYAEFCRSQKSFAKLATVYAQALALHPKQTGLWIAAASHEFFQSSAPHTARILLQRGIRVNPTSPDLWLQSLVMELHLVQKLRGRRDILRGAGRGGEEEEDKEFSEHKIARLLYDNAIQAIPDRVEFRLQCLDQCRLFPNTEDLQAYIHISMERDCSSRPEAWIARAMHEWERHRKLGENEKSSIGFLHSNGLGDDLNQRQEDNPQRKKARTLLHHEQEARDDVLKVIKQAVDTLSSHEMYLQGIRFLLSYMQELAEELEESDDSKEKLERSQRFLFQLFDQAKTLHFETSDLILEQVAFLALVESDQEASQCIQNFVENHPTKASIDVWRRYAAMSPDQAVDILEEAAKYISVEQEAHMVVLLELFGAKLAIPDEKSLPVLFQTILLLAPGFGEMKDVEDPVYGIKNISCACLQYLRYASKHHGLNEMRRIYQAVLFESSLGTLEGGDPSLINIFLEEAMKAEEEFGSSKETRCQLRRLCDIALQLFENTDEEEKYRWRKENILYG
jgi:U3 small nucleolar RNA-associated protein 6